MVKRLCGVFFLALGLAFSISGFVMLAQPNVPVRFNGVLTTSIKPKLFIALFPLLHAVVGAFLTFDLARYWTEWREKRRREQGASRKPDRLPSWAYSKSYRPQPSPFMQKYGSLIIGIPMSLLFLALGLWIIHIAWQGHTPAQTLSKKEIPALMAMGAFFAWGGIQGLFLVIGGERLPKWVHAILLSVLIVCLAAPFLLAGILAPDQITSTASIGALVLEQEPGGRSGGIVFIAVGVLLLVGLPFIVRNVLSKKW